MALCRRRAVRERCPKGSRTDSYLRDFGGHLPLFRAEILNAASHDAPGTCRELMCPENQPPDSWMKGYSEVVSFERRTRDLWIWALTLSCNNSSRGRGFVPPRPTESILLLSMHFLDFRGVGRRQLVSRTSNHLLSATWPHPNLGLPW